MLTYASSSLQTFFGTLDDKNVPVDMGCLNRQKYVLRGWFVDGAISGRGVVKSVGEYYYRGDTKRNLYEGTGTLVTVKSLTGKPVDGTQHTSPWQPAPHYFVGEFTGGQKHGFGLCMPLGCGYVMEAAMTMANYVSGLPEGFMTAKFSGYSFEGFVRSGFADGIGKENTFKHKFHGQFSRGKPQGIGLAKYAGQAYYVGYWQEGLRNHFGEEVTASGDKFEGDWSGGAMEGMSRIKYAAIALDSPSRRDKTLEHGALYIGNCVKGQHQGFGKLEAMDGTYVGGWREGLRSGLGYFQLRNKDDYYFGEWSNGKRNGIGKCKNSEYKYHGEWADDLRHGIGFLIPTGKTESLVKFDRGVMTGPVIVGGTEYKARFSKHNLQDFSTNAKLMLEKIEVDIKIKSEKMKEAFRKLPLDLRDQKSRLESNCLQVLRKAEEASEEIQQLEESLKRMAEQKKVMLECVSHDPNVEDPIVKMDKSSSTKAGIPRASMQSQIPIIGIGDFQTPNHSMMTSSYKNLPDRGNGLSSSNSLTAPNQRQNNPKESNHAEETTPIKVNVPDANVGTGTPLKVSSAEGVQGARNQLGKESTNNNDQAKKTSGASNADHSARQPTTPQNRHENESANSNQNIHSNKSPANQNDSQSKVVRDSEQPRVSSFAESETPVQMERKRSVRFVEPEGAENAPTDESTKPQGLNKSQNLSGSATSKSSKSKQKINKTGEFHDSIGKESVVEEPNALSSSRSNSKVSKRKKSEDKKLTQQCINDALQSYKKNQDTLLKQSNKVDQRESELKKEELNLRRLDKNLKEKADFLDEQREKLKKERAENARERETLTLQKMTIKQRIHETGEKQEDHIPIGFNKAELDMIKKCKEEEQNKLENFRKKQKANLDEIRSQRLALEMALMVAQSDFEQNNKGPNQETAVKNNKEMNATSTQTDDNLLNSPKKDGNLSLNFGAFDKPKKDEEPTHLVKPSLEVVKDEQKKEEKGENSPKAASDTSYGNIFGENQMDFLADYLDGLAKGELKPDDSDPEKRQIRENVTNMEYELENLKKAKEANETSASKQIKAFEEDLEKNRKRIAELKAKIDSNAAASQPKSRVKKPTAMDDLLNNNQYESTREPLKELTESAQPTEEDIKASKEAESIIKPNFSKATDISKLTDGNSSKLR